MSKYIVRRLLWLLFTVWGLSLLVFIGIRLVPGDTVDMILGTDFVLTEEQAMALRRYYGLDKPIPQQYLLWLRAALRGDMGISIRSGRSAMAEVLARFPLTVQLALLSLIVALAVGIPLGIASALKPDSALDSLARVFSLLGMSVPEFVIATVIIWVLSVRFHWSPLDIGMGASSGGIVGTLKRLAFPSLALGAAMAAGVARMIRSSLLEVMRQDYVRTARSKGLRERTVVMRHCLKNALIPVITLVGIHFGRMLGGTVVVEEIFALPGIGRLTLYAILQRDYAMLQAAILLIALCYVGMNLIADLLYAFVDPRIRYQ